MLAIAFGYGQWRIAQPIQGQSFRYALVQGNIDQTEKWSAGSLHRIVDTYLSLSAKAKDAQVLVWPETAVPEFLRNNLAIYGSLADFAKSHHQHLLTGTLDWKNGKALKLFNSTTVFSDAGVNVGFDAKTHLVPLGEYLPFRDIMPKPIADMLAQFNIVSHDYAPAEHPRAFSLPFARLGTAVCFDSIFPGVVSDKVRAGANALVVVTNDAWYKRTAAPVQHLSQSVLRAVETGRYLMRAANTGITCGIDPNGKIYSPTRLYEPAVVEGVAITQNHITPYVRFGDWLSWLAMLVSAAFFALALWRSR
jgi:apolipoprotein N-acyltransferase